MSKDYKTIWSSAYGAAFASLVSRLHHGFSYMEIAKEAAELAHQAVKEAITVNIMLPSAPEPLGHLETCGTMYRGCSPDCPKDMAERMRADLLDLVDSACAESNDAYAALMSYARRRLNKVPDSDKQELFEEVLDGFERDPEDVEALVNFFDEALDFEVKLPSIEPCKHADECSTTHSKPSRFIEHEPMLPMPLFLYAKRQPVGDEPIDGQTSIACSHIPCPDGSTTAYVAWRLAGSEEIAQLRKEVVELRRQLDDAAVHIEVEQREHEETKGYRQHAEKMLADAQSAANAPVWNMTSARLPPSNVPIVTCKEIQNEYEVMEYDEGNNAWGDDLNGWIEHGSSETPHYWLVIPQPPTEPEEK